MAAARSRWQAPAVVGVIVLGMLSRRSQGISLRIPLSDAAVDQLLGATFSAKFNNCTGNSSAASWCDQSNPYAIAQPLVFNANGTIKNTTNGSSVAAVEVAAADSATDGSGNNKFQRMRDAYTRTFTCDGEDADSLCRMVTQLTYIDGAAVAPRTVSHIPICSFVKDTCPGMYWSDFTNNSYCYASQSNCENDCHGWWCPGDPNATVNVTGFYAGRLFVTATNSFDPDTGAIVTSADVYDGNLNSVVLSSSNMEVYFVLAISDPTYGFQWLVYAAQPSSYVVRLAPSPVSCWPDNLQFR
jgi:hypothetical protein